MVQHMASGESAFTYGYCEFAGMISLTDPDGYFAPGYLPRDNKDDQVHLSDGVDALGAGEMLDIYRAAYDRFLNG